jgi:hypothetical protein
MTHVLTLAWCSRPKREGPWSTLSLGFVSLDSLPARTPTTVVGLGRVMANATRIRCDYRCAECLKVFVLLSGEVARE